MDKIRQENKILQLCSKNYNSRINILNLLLLNFHCVLMIFNISISMDFSRDFIQRSKVMVILMQFKSKLKKVKNQIKIQVVLKRKENIQESHQMRSWNRRWEVICWHLSSLLKIVITLMTKIQCLMMVEFDDFYIRILLV